MQGGQDHDNNYLKTYEKQLARKKTRQKSTFFWVSEDQVSYEEKMQH